jgi:hypothetical protein
MTKRIEDEASAVLKFGNSGMNLDTADAYDKLYSEIFKLESMARETFQHQYRQDYQAVVKKLQDGDYLTEDDKQLLAELVIADAKSYVKHAKEFENWKDHIDRLLAELNQIRAQHVQTTDDLLHIQSICRDLRSVLPDITFYLRERERVQSYEQNDLQSLSPDMKKLLAEVIDAMMKSDKM